jgi:hypothetical protein
LLVVENVNWKKIQFEKKVKGHENNKLVHFAKCLLVQLDWIIGKRQWKLKCYDQFILWTLELNFVWDF